MKFVAAALLACLVVAPTAASPRAWPVYVNVLYRYRACYPADLLRPQGETDNSAGQAFRGRDGAELDVYSYYPDDQSLSKEMRDSATVSAGRRGKVTYRRVTANWGVASGSDGAKHRFYIKMLKRQDQIVKLEIRYPARLMRRYDPIAAKAASCLALVR